MLCRIADLFVEVPDTGGLAPRVRDYLWEKDEQADITICESDFRPHAWKGTPRNTYCYMESGANFYANLLRYNGMMLHASAVAYNGRAYLFSGPSGIGKSTHTRLWKRTFGDSVIVFNDDKPALRFLDGQWYAYGTPWCGKDGINQNMRVPLAGICFLEKGQENAISLLSPKEAVPHIISQTMYRFKKSENTQLFLKNLDRLVMSIPMFYLVNRADAESARLSYTHMLRQAAELGL
jgi:hypothetical protein